MADIYSNSNIILKSMMVVFNYLKKNNFTAGKDIEFEMALKRLMAFWSLNPSESALFVCIFITYFDFSEKPVNIGLLSGDFCNSSLRFLEFREEFISLEEKGFIYSASKDIPDSNSKFYRVTEGVVTAILKNDKNLLQKELRVRDKNLKYPDEISHKELFYSNEIKNEIAKITEYLSNDKFEAIQRRLEEKCMPKGVCIMFYGESGTGKTELARYLSKTLHKKLLLKRASDILGRFVGENEQNIRDAFLEAEETDSVLLFDEADTFFSDRQNAEKSWERTMVNEFLTQMEEFSGILICTTNLRSIMDPAIQRRFHIMTEFKALTKIGVESLLQKYFPEKQFSEPKIQALARYNSVTPGDFGSLNGRITFMPSERVTSDYILDELIEMQKEKSKTASCSIGFAC